MVNELEVPFALTGLQVDCNNAFAEKACAGPVAAGNLRSSHVGRRRERWVGKKDVPLPPGTTRAGGTDVGFGGEFQGIKNVFLRAGYTTQTAITGGMMAEAAPSAACAATTKRNFG